MTSPPEPLADHTEPRGPFARQQNAEPLSWLRQPLKRYGTCALTFSVAAGAILVRSGLVPQGKGLVLGTIFSIINFALMAVALPMRLGRRRGPSTAISLFSITMRLALLAVPLVIAVRQSQFDVFATAAGLFMVQVTIVLDQAWVGRRHYLRTEA